MRGRDGIVIHMTETDVRNQVKRMVAGARFASEVADQLNVSPQYLHDFLKGRRQPGKKILTALGLQKVIIYKAR